MSSKRITILIFSIGIASIVVLAVFGVYDYLIHRPKDTDIITQADRGLSVKELTKWRNRVEEAEEKLKVNPNSHDVLLSLAIAKASLGYYTEAEKIYLKMNELFPKNFLSYSNLGNLYVTMNAPWRAEKMYLRAIEVAPTNVTLYRSIVDLYRYYLREKVSEVEPFLLKGLKINPDHVDLVSMLAVYYREETDKVDEAIKYYEKLIKLNPNNETAKDELEELKEKKKAEGK